MAATKGRYQTKYLVTFRGERMSLNQAAKLLGFYDATTFYARVTNGMTAQEAIDTPTHNYKTVARQLALKKGALVYMGRVHKRCGTRLKFTDSCKCVECIGDY